MWPEHVPAGGQVRPTVQRCRTSCWCRIATAPARKGRNSRLACFAVRPRSVRIAVLPAEFKESDGEDVRDVLRRTGGRDLVLQAIADAQLAGRMGRPR